MTQNTTNQSGEAKEPKATGGAIHPETYQVQEERSAQRRIYIRSFKKRANDRRTTIEKIADWMTSRFGTVTFLILNLLVYAFWIAWNTSSIPGLVPFDPYPFGLLTMAMSIEAIILAIVVLISQNREAKVTELREEMNLQVDLIAEEELMLVYAFWIAWNTSSIPGLVPFDPYPFGLLTMAMSIEAIILAIVVLISQNREAKVTELREEMNLQVDLIAEEELTKVLKMMAILLEKHGVDLSGDRELQSMLQPLRNNRIEQRLEQQLK